jgi:DNA invertase Pin-like site-specific DNA recombinase
MAVKYAIIYLRLSDFRDGDDDGTFTAREEELRALAAALGLIVLRVVVENDVRSDGRLKSASAYKTPRKVRDGNGLITRRTNREKFTEVLIALQRREAAVLIAGDESRISREWRDALDLLDVVKASGVSVVVPDEDGEPKFLLTDGGTPGQRDAFMNKVDEARKYSATIAANVRKGRRRWAGVSYMGGRRPFGYRVEQGTEEHKRNLIVDEREAAVLRDAADVILDKGVSLKSRARDLRDATGDAYVPTVTGAAWTASTLRDLLAKPAVAGLAVGRDGDLIPAPWPEIIPRDRWERLVALFAANAAARPNTSNEPRWLVSGIATCGICNDGTTVRVTGSADRRAYVCSAHGHLRRNAYKVDELVAARVVALLERDAAELLKPQPRAADVDTGRLRAEAQRLTDTSDDLARLYAEKILTEAGVRKERRRIDTRLAQITAELAASDTTDPLPEIRGHDADMLAVWDSLAGPRDPDGRLRAGPRQRAIVKLLYDIVIMPLAHPGGNKFDESSVVMTRKTAT